MTVQITQTFSPKNPADWREWLSQHHDRKKEIWLVFYKKSTGKQTVSYNEALNEALCVGWIDGIEKGIDSDRFAIRFTPRSQKSAWSEINVKRYKELLGENRMKQAGVAAFENKHHVYTSFSNKKGATEWHQTHKMPKHPSIEERIAWHRDHQKFCGCRPVPKSLIVYLRGSRPRR